MYWYNLGLEMGGLMEDPEFHIESIATIEASCLSEAKDLWAVKTNHIGKSWDPKTKSCWGWLVVCLGTNDPSVSDLYYSRKL